MMMAKTQRGYTLIEIAIVLTVTLMMTGWLASSYFKVQEDRKNAEAKKTIEIIKNEIIEYATRQRTKSYFIVNGDATNKIPHRTSAVRPYLPCPDITGDGLEDRRPLLSAATLTVMASANTYPLEMGGNCYLNKGLVPWKTLGTPVSDPWGNFYTYRVDDSFSNAMLGFDASMKANDTFYTRPLTVHVDTATTTTLVVRPTQRNVGGNRSVTLRSATLTIAGIISTIWADGIGRDDRLDSDTAPNIICSGIPCSRYSLAPNPDSFDPSLPVPPAVSLLAGNIIPSSEEATVRVNEIFDKIPVYAVLAEDHIENGVPLVVLSHGKNGNGAVPSGGEPFGEEARVMFCKDFPSRAGNEEERQNAHRLNFLNTEHVVNSITISFRCISNRPSDPTFEENSRQHGFVVRPIEGGVFDDIVGWLSTEELMQAMSKRNALPKDLLPPIGLEDIADD